MNRLHSPALYRGMTQPRTRRDVFRLAGLSAAGLALAACGVQGQKAAPPKADAVADYWASQKKNGKVVFANWPEYMPEDHGPLKKFQQETGISYEYKEVINENTEFFGKADPVLRAGQPLGYDIVVMTNGIQLQHMFELGYAVTLDQSKMTNFQANAAEAYKNRAYDPGNKYTMPFASGFTGIAYNTKYVKDDITSIQAMFDAKYEGRVGMMADAQEIANFGMIALGVDPEKSTEDDWKKAGEKLQAQRDAGIVRKYYNQDYIDALSRGDIWVSMAWSGDVFQRQLAGEPVKFVIPEEGGTIWTDNMLIPKGAANPVDAMMLMDFLYKPEIAAELDEFIQFVTPVPAVQELLREKAASASGDDKKALLDMAESPLMFPTEADYAKLHSYTPLTTAQEQVFNPIFQSVTQA
ncbi:MULTISPECIES: ABC transporter substrate-binding protein [Nonomuraea]|uniref:Spermidine/putrescine ABC transporter substrate-binding protein n=1 Tax=Nonomuraea ferruginea TaxID=46174 RepID=A0ABT4SQF5_9ACTN|nr:MULTISPECIES: spermidine/putrescine ABC transporter substrate-binding protein [Nonomuraea]MDA0639478.1 spermidine/putrescine ABC transporter substrate-binding protein [Nonomuraea ferruginea]TXK42938.1 spermidine/putrescine ABC transporter substrate-binding protein [Nonomuraea sp. C10]